MSSTHAVLLTLIFPILYPVRCRLHMLYSTINTYISYSISSTMSSTHAVLLTLIFLFYIQYDVVYTCCTVNTYISYSISSTMSSTHAVLLTLIFPILYPVRCRLHMLYCLHLYFLFYIQYDVVYTCCTVNTYISYSISSTMSSTHAVQYY